MPKIINYCTFHLKVHTSTCIAGRKSTFPMAQDMWNFKVGNGKHTTKVCVHLDLEVEPEQEEVVKELVKYVSIIEKLVKTCA